MTDFSLDKLLGNSYLQLQQTTPGTTAESRTAYLEKMRNCSRGITPTTVSYRYGTD